MRVVDRRPAFEREPAERELLNGCQSCAVTGPATRHKTRVTSQRLRSLARMGIMIAYDSRRDASILCGAFLLLGGAISADAPDPADWSRFRGPNGSGVRSRTAPAPRSSGPTTNVVWKTELPFGHSSPALTQRSDFSDRRARRPARHHLPRSQDRPRSSGSATRHGRARRSSTTATARPDRRRRPTAQNVYVFFADFGLHLA